MRSAMQALSGLGRPALTSPERSSASGTAQAESGSRSVSERASDLVLCMPRGYSALMHPATGFLLFVLTVVGMEGFAWGMHRWVMHGPGWFLHSSHHRPRTGPFEWNDLYAVLFALPSILLLYGGVQRGWWPGTI